MTQCRREKQEQPWRYVGSFSNARQGTGWCLGTDVLASAGQWCCLIAQCDAILQGIISLLKSFTSLGILNKNFHRKKIWGWKMKFGNDKVKAFLWSSPWLRDHICMSNREWGGVGYSKWVSYGGALSDPLQRLDGMHSMRHVATQQTMSIKIKIEQLPHLLSTSILYIEQAWVPVGGKKKRLIVLAIYIGCMRIYQYRMLSKAGICPGLQTDIRIKDILENIAFLATCVGSKEL